MKRIFALILGIFLWLNVVPTALAENTRLVPCAESSVFVERVQNAADSYYTTKPLRAYSRLLCGEDGLPHLVLDRLSLALDVLTPIVIFLYIAGWIGWTGRSYLRAIQKLGSQEEKEIFIDIPLFVKSMVLAFLWPASAVQEFLSGDLVNKDEEIPISIR
ncbi:Photosystem I reaction center subunit III [Nostoc sp. ChiQUE01b]|uniref:Photosystem I reaction center subunit III n=1 Tax=Nostoc sp. ChiQUE01b TaxID=3075376 RepID=UPI002AD1EEC2|nr:Photosystem I reaction center subunit III [Nostoc sp. ChiQUE01b]MDZ8262777.1 Photosystem I reaction center subunit III [Nostoc sp. ChiQUE01b]